MGGGGSVPEKVTVAILDLSSRGAKTAKDLTNAQSVARITRNVRQSEDILCEVPRSARDDAPSRFAGEIRYAA
jgi:hypothetical protein